MSPPGDSCHSGPSEPPLTNGHRTTHMAPESSAPIPPHTESETRDPVPAVQAKPEQLSVSIAGM